MLSKREKNQLYEAIVAEGLDPAEFRLEDKFFRVVITHNSGSTFKLTPGGEGFETILHVTDGIDATANEKNVEGTAKHSFLHWLTEIRATGGVPDYWEEMRRSRESISAIRYAGLGNLPFTLAERRQISAQFLEIQIKLDQFQLPDEQMSQVGERLDELEGASHELGRKDWLITFMATMSPLVVDDIVTPGLARHVFTLAVDGLIHLFTGAGGPRQGHGRSDAEV